MQNVREYEGDQRRNLGRAILTAPTAPRGVCGAGECHCIAICLEQWGHKKSFPINIPSTLQHKVQEKAVTSGLPTFSKWNMASCCVFHCTLSKYFCSQSACSLGLLPFFGEILMLVTSAQVLKTILNFMYGISIELEVQLLIDFKEIYGSFWSACLWISRNARICTGLSPCF